MRRGAIIFVIILFFANSTVFASKQKKAIKMYKEAVKLGNKGKVDEAIDLFKKSIKLFPDLYVSYVKLGIAYKMKGRIPESLAWYDRGVKVKTHKEVCLNARGEFYLDYGLIDLAEKDFRKAIKYAKGKKYLKKPYENLVYVLLKQKKYDEALKVIDKGLKKLKKDEKLLYYKGYVYIQKGDTIKAEKIFNKLLKEFKDSPLGLYGLGIVYHKAGHNDEAKEYLKKACSMKYRKACKELSRISVKKLN